MTVDQLETQGLFLVAGKNGTVSLVWGDVWLRNVMWAGALRLQRDIGRLRDEGRHLEAVRLFTSRLIYRTMNS